MSLQVIDEDQYTHAVQYGGGTFKLDKKDIGTRYVVAAVRILVDPSDSEDVQQVHKLQDGMRAVQTGGPGTVEVPKWDPISQKKVRDALLVLASTLPDTSRMYGKKDEVDPVRFVIGAATGWGANPPKEALYLNIFPKMFFHLSRCIVIDHAGPDVRIRGAFQLPFKTSGLGI